MKPEWNDPNEASRRSRGWTWYAVVRLVTLSIAVAAQARAASFLRGDANIDGRVHVDDALAILEVQLLGQGEFPCDSAADADGDGRLDGNDAIRILDFLYAEGPPPAEPYPWCGDDATKDPLTCGKYDACGEPKELPEEQSALSEETFLETRTTSAGLTACGHYLPANRFEWWDTPAPETAAIGNALITTTDPRTPDEVFLSEFCSPLSTVVGADTQAGSALMAGRAISWEGLADGESPNAVDGIEFHVRGLPAGMAPVIREVATDLGPLGRARRKLVVAGESASVALSPPVLRVDFAVSQRSVGLEYGFRGPDGVSLDPDSFELVAFDDRGNVLVSSLGGDLWGANHHWSANSVLHKIAVRHQGGAIRSMELRYTHPEITMPLLLYRLWHEPLPPAAVKQGACAKEFDPYGERSGYDGSTGTVTLKLPFACDRAVVMLRGFKLRFIEGGADVNRLEAGVDAPTVFEVERGGTVSFEPAGLLDHVSTQRPAYLAVAYYAVLAWDSDRVDLHATGNSALVYSDSETLGKPLALKDPCPSASADAGSCGPLYGALRSFGFRLRESQEIDRLGWSCGQQGYSSAEGCVFEEGGGGFNLPTFEFGIPHLDRVQTEISWGQCSVLEGADDCRHWRALTGTVLTGTSLKLQDQPRSALAFSAGRVGPRPPNNPFLYEVGVHSGLAWPVSGDLAFVSLGSFYFAPEGPIAELDIEVRGADYDGSSVGWQFGGGILAQRMVAGGLSTPGPWFMTGWPNFGALARKVVRPEMRLSTSDVVFGGGCVGTVSRAPDVIGWVRNDGNIPVEITSVADVGPDDAEFELEFTYRGQKLGGAEALARLVPFELGPGEEIRVSGGFQPSEHPPAPDTVVPPDQRLTIIELTTASWRQPRVVIQARGHLVPADPRGYLLPSRIDFGRQALGTRRSSNATLGSHGSTPLLVTDARLESSRAGFSLEGIFPAQVDPGSFWDFSLAFRPTIVGELSTRAVIQTNAGEFVLDLRGEGVWR